MTSSLSTNMLIDLLQLQLNSNNSIEIAEGIEQYFDKEVSIDYIEFYLEQNGSINREQRDSTYYSTCYNARLSC